MVVAVMIRLEAEHQKVEPGRWLGVICRLLQTVVRVVLVSLTNLNTLRRMTRECGLNNIYIHLSSSLPPIPDLHTGSVFDWALTEWPDIRSSQISLHHE